MIGLVNGLYPDYDDEPLYVKVLRKWRKRDRVDNSIEIIFSDQMGDKVQATIPWFFISLFDDLLSEGSWYYISDFAVVNETRSIRNTEHGCRVLFNEKTKVRRSLKVCNDEFYCFIDFLNILDHSFPAINHAIDLYGIVDSVEPQIICLDHHYEEFYGDRVKMVRFKLWDINGWHLNCVALNETADTLTALWNGHTNTIRLLAVLSVWRVYYEDGTPTITSGKKVSRILLNPPVDEIDQLRQALEMENESESDAESDNSV